jgi:hypothetical protein
VSTAPDDDTRCPDGGACHHLCALANGPRRCVRVQNSGPLTGVFPGDRWPDAVLTANGITPPPRLVADPPPAASVVQSIESSAFQIVAPDGVVLLRITADGQWIVNADDAPEAAQVFLDAVARQLVNRNVLAMLAAPIRDYLNALHPDQAHVNVIDRAGTGTQPPLRLSDLRVLINTILPPGGTR